MTVSGPELDIDERLTIMEKRLVALRNGAGEYRQCDRDYAIKQAAKALKKLRRNAT